METGKTNTPYSSYMEIKYSGRYQTWSLLQETPDTPIQHVKSKSSTTIVSKEQLVLLANRLVIKKNNQHVASDSDITDTMLRFVVVILRHHKLYKPVSLTAVTPQPDSKKPYTKPPTENQILGFIKTLGYDEDPKAKMTYVLTFAATRLRQPWRAILSELAEYINTPNWNRPIVYYDDDDDDDDDEDYTIANTPVLSTKEPVDSLSMGDEHLDTILETELDKVVKSSVEDLVPIPSESEGIFDNMCDVPCCDKNHFDAESDLMESLLNRDTSIIYSSKIDSLLEEFAGELAPINPIPSGIHPEKDIRLIEQFIIMIISRVRLFS
ncbi:hypothetical protein Tco_0357265 [Tanacetum coccineum]